MWVLATQNLSFFSCTQVLAGAKRRLVGINRHCVAGRDPRAPSKQIRNQLANTQHATVRQTDRFRNNLGDRFPGIVVIGPPESRESRPNSKTFKKKIKRPNSEFQIPSPIRIPMESRQVILNFQIQIPNSSFPFGNANKEQSVRRVSATSPPLLRHSEFQFQTQ